MRYCAAEGVIAWSGGTTVLRPGTRYEDNHPLVRERPELFRDSDPENDVRTVSSIEQATSAPGEVRATPGTGRPANRVPRGGSGQ